MVNLGIQYEIWYSTCIFINNWCTSYTNELVLCPVTPQEEIVLFHRDLCNLMEIYFQVDKKYKYKYQQSLSYQSINNATFQSCATIGQSTILNTTLTTSQ